MKSNAGSIIAAILHFFWLYVLFTLAAHANVGTGGAVGTILGILTVGFSILSVGYVYVSAFSYGKGMVMVDEGDAAFPVHETFHTLRSVKVPGVAELVVVVKDRKGMLWAVRMAEMPPDVFQKVDDAKAPYQKYPA